MSKYTAVHQHAIFIEAKLKSEDEYMSIELCVTADMLMVCEAMLIRVRHHAFCFSFTKIMEFEVCLCIWRNISSIRPDTTLSRDCDSPSPFEKVLRAWELTTPTSVLPPRDESFHDLRQTCPGPRKVVYLSRHLVAIRTVEVVRESRKPMSRNCERQYGQIKTPLPDPSIAVSSNTWSPLVGFSRISNLN